VNSDRGREDVQRFPIPADIRVVDKEGFTTMETLIFAGVTAVLLAFLGGVTTASRAGVRSR